MNYPLLINALYKTYEEVPNREELVVSMIKILLT